MNKKKKLHKKLLQLGYNIPLESIVWDAGGPHFEFDGNNQCWMIDFDMLTEEQEDLFYPESHSHKGGLHADFLGGNFEEAMEYISTWPKVELKTEGDL